VWWRIAWRNLGRNRKRSAITAAALALGYLAAVLMVGVSDGMTAEMIENGTGLITGQVEVAAPGYRPERSLYATIGGDSGIDVRAVVESVASVAGVVGAAPRVYGGGLLSAGGATVGVMLEGIDPRLEGGVSRVLEMLVAGRGLQPGEHALLIGVELARKLRAAPGSSLVVVAPAADGSLGNDLYTVAGVFRTGLPGFDGAYAFAPLTALQGLLALAPGRIHEVAAAVRDPWAAPVVAAQVAARLRGAGVAIAAEPWTRFRPELRAYASLAGASNGLIVGIICLMAMFGVANTMLMGTFERRREFAVIRALGTTPGGVVQTVLCEGVILGGLALVAGAAITAPILVWWHTAPPDVSRLFGGFTMAGALIPPVLRVEYSVAAPLGSAAALLVTALLAALYPAVRAARVPPADALAGR
jgi:ABC-type lipoprotein release transport system permease subunit